MGGGISMVSPYLRKPLRSLREALESGQAPPQRRSGSPDSVEARPREARPTEVRPTEARPTEARPTGELLGGGEAQPERADPLLPS